LDLLFVFRIGNSYRIGTISPSFFSPQTIYSTGTKEAVKNILMTSSIY
jgi:hypothetical protein